MTQKNPTDGQTEMSNFVFTSKYARYNEKLKRRETWEEAVSRVETMHLKKYAFVEEKYKEEIKKAFDLVREKRVVPSMRSLQFGGLAIESKNPRMFNCAVRHIDSIRAFAEVFFLSLCGCGIGVGLTSKFLNRLPDLVDASDKTGVILPYTVLDTIEGWADSIEVLLKCYTKNNAFTGRKVVFDYSRIRRKGSKLKTGGGKAPGYVPLKKAHAKIKHLLDNLIEEKNLKRLRAIDVCDIICHCADSVLSGGIRRSALSMVFEKGDKEMMTAKVGKWFEENPQRARANNSVLLVRSETQQSDFEEVIKASREFGEPGFVFASSSEVLLNPCFTIDTKVLTVNGWRTFESLLASEPFEIIQDGRVRGKLTPSGEKWEYSEKNLVPFRNTVSKVRKTGTLQDIYEVETKSGRKVKCTSNHHFATLRGMIEAKDLTTDDEILVGMPELYSPRKDSLDYKIGYLFGLFGGDGCVGKKNVNLDIWGDKKILTKIESLVQEVINSPLHKDVLRIKSPFPASLEPKFREGTRVGNVERFRLTSPILYRIFQEHGCLDKKEISWVHLKDKNFKAGFVSGLFYCDGHVEYNENKKSLSCRITQSDRNFLGELQLILQELGVFSSIYDLLPAGRRMLPDSERKMRLYDMKASFRLVIGGLTESRKFFTLLADTGEKEEKFRKIEAKYQREILPPYATKVVAVKYIGKEDVYCLQEDNVRTLIAEGLTARRCFEICFLPETEDGVCGVQFCNLTSINGAKIETKEDFEECAKAASLIGTLQAGYTDFNYLSHVAKKLTEEEALLGVSITGVMDNPKVLLNPEHQRDCAKLVNETNEKWAKIININPSARTTCIKPEGTSSTVLCSASGIHPHHSPKYFRRVQVNKQENVYNFFKLLNPDFSEESKWSTNKTDDIVTFPIEIKKSAMFKKDLSAIEHLEIIKKTQKNWVSPGTSKHNKKDIEHSVSCTVSVGEKEWEGVIDYLYKNRYFFTAVSLLPHDGDQIYEQAPFEAVTPETLEKFNKLKEELEHVDYTQLTENHDETTLQQEIACGGGKCELA